MKPQILIPLILALSIITFAGVNAVAVNPPNISVWYSDADYASFVSGSAPIREILLDNTLGKGHDAFLTAVRQWDATLPIDVVSDLALPSRFDMYLGKRSQLVAYEPDLLNTSKTGLAVHKNGKVATTLYNGRLKTINEVYSGTAYVVTDDRLPKAINKTALHELGHVIGWGGHSPVSTDVMYSQASSNDVLSYRDKYHLRNIYYNFK